MKKTTAALLAATAMFCTSALADNPCAFSIGGHPGLAILGDSSGSHFDAGLHASYAFLPPLTADFNFSYIDKGGLNINGMQATGSLYLLYASLMYDTTILYPGTSAGMAMGIGLDHLSLNSPGTSTSTTTDSFIIGPKLGYDYFMKPSLSIGGQADWLINTHANEPNILEVLFVVKWWL